MYPALSGFYKGEGGYEPNCSGVIATRGFNRRHLEKIDCWDVPVLRGVIDVPALRQDGSLLDRPGYDDATGLFFCGNSSDLVEVPHDPTMDEVQDAVPALWRPFEDFEFRTDVDRGVHLAALLTTAQRPMLSTAPAVAYTSASGASGKTLLALSVGCLANGTVPAAMSAPADLREMEKVLFSALYGDQKVILFDNLSGSFDSLALSAFLSNQEFYFRALDKNVALHMPNKAQVLMTGSDLEFSGDISRRVLACHLDPQTENPHLLKHDLDPVRHVLDHRQELMVAVLTILRGYLRHKTENAKDTLGSFEEWSELIRGAVKWIGEEGLLNVGDPLQANQRSAEETRRLHDLLNNWYAAFGNYPFTVTALVNATDAFQHDCRTIGDHHRNVRSIIEDISNEPDGINVKRLARWLMRHRDRVVGGKRLVASKMSNRVHWRVMRVRDM